MKQPTIPRVLSLILWFSFSLITSLSSFAKTGENAISFSTQTLSGQPYHFDINSLDKPHLLVFWATWCLECRYEFHALNALHAERLDQIEIVGISIDQDPSAALTMQKEANLTYVNIIDDKAIIAKQYKVKGTPTLIFVDQNGLIISEGHRLDDTLKQQISRLISP